MGAFLGLDYGLRRIGIAASDPDGVLAFALETHTEGRDGSVLDRLAALIAERDVRVLVVGLPLTADGRKGEIALRAESFAARLGERFGLEVVLWDERFTSAEADRYLQGASRPAKTDRDAVAAALILQGYLDSRRAQGPGVPDGGEEP